MKFSCRRKLADGSTEWTKGKVQKLIYGPRQCKLTLFRLVCSFSGNLAETLSYEIGMKNKELQMTEFKEFSITRPERKSRSFVSCMSRMIAFDDWALFLFAMETFRLHGGDLVVAYVNCALKQVMDLMKLYEKDGLMAIRHGYRAPQTNSVLYDPDAETEYSNQMTNSHECLYEFKESAEFIAFTDWDDVLVSPGSGSFASAFQKLANLDPLAGSFAVERLDSFLPTAFTKKNKFSLEKAVTEMGYCRKLADGKLVVKPERVAGVWIHKLIVPEKSKFKEITVDKKSAVLLHIHNLTYGGDTNPSKYPDFKLLYHLIYKCYYGIDLQVSTDSILYCPTHKSCKYPKQELEVIKIQTDYRQALKTGDLIWHERSKISFIESEDGCL